MQAHFAMFARYNEWANLRICACAAALPDADYRADGGAFFGSVHRTLNHILVADRIWMRRFTGEGPVHTDLEAVPYDTLAELRGARKQEDRRILAYVDRLDARALEGSFSYQTIVNPTEITQRLAPALAHFFNHQTHHRGQVPALLTAIGGREAAVALDLIQVQRETGVGLG